MPQEFAVPDEKFEELVSRYNRDITAQVKAGKFDPVIGREDEIHDMILTLIQRGRKNVMLLAGAGVGKTALFIKLAQTIVAGEVPEALKDARLIELEMSSMSAGTASRSDYEGRLIPMVRGAAERNATKKFPRIIFCIDEIHMIMHGVPASGAAGTSDILKPYLTTGDLSVVGATTEDEYRDYVKWDAALDRRFSKMHVAVPSIPETVHILTGLKPLYEKHFGITIPEPLLPEIVDLATRFMPSRNRPDSAIITMDAACARAILSEGRGSELAHIHVAQAIGSEVSLPAEAIG